MNSVFGKLVFGLGIAFFFGYLAISVGLGAVMPSLYKVATPFLCEEGESLEVVQKTQRWRDGASMVSARIFIVSGLKKEDRTSAVKLVSGAVYGLAIFLLLLPKLCRKTKPVAASEESVTPPSEDP